MRVAEKRIGKRLRKARRDLGLTLEVVAKRVGFKNYQVLSNIETGKRDLKFSELVMLCGILHKDPQYFILQDEPIHSEPVFACRSAQDKKKLKEVQAHFSRILSDYYLIEKITNEFTPPSIEAWKVSENSLDFNEVTSKAEEFVETYNLGIRPFLNLPQVLEEKAKIKILYLPTEQACSAVSTIGDFGYAIIIDSDEAPWRRNFNLAHELFHFLSREYFPLDKIHGTVDCDQEKPIYEKLADAFAAVLLMPSGPIKEEVNKRIKDNKLALIDLIRTAIDFGVSTEALLWRLCTLEILKRETVEKTILSAGYKQFNRSERHNSNKSANIYSKRFVFLSVKALKEKKISHRKLCEIFETDRTRIWKMVSEYGFDVMEDLKNESQIEASRS